MPITFGSIGDIISISLLVKDLLNVLNGARGSSTKYQLVVRELLILDRTLLEVDIFCRTHEGTPELDALCVTARQAAESCRKLIDEFTRKINKYKPSLVERSSSTAANKAAMKIRWEVCMEDDVVRFRADISAQAQSMKMLLAFASIKLLNLTNSKLDARLSDVERKTTESAKQTDTAPQEVKSRLEETSMLISAGNALAGKIADGLRFQWLNDLGMDVKRSMLGIFSMNLVIYGVVTAVQKTIPSGPLFEEPFWLEDAMGRVFPVHLQFIGSWEALHAVLETHFRDMQGARKIIDKEYILQDHATGDGIDQTKRWEGSFLPGQRWL